MEIPDGNGLHHPTTKLQPEISIKIPSREECDEGRVPFENELAIFTDGSKMVAGTGTGVSLEMHIPRLDLRMDAMFTKLKLLQ